MNIIQKLTVSHLKSNKKRTIVTIMGIIISVAMVAAVFTSAVSFMKFLQNIEESYGGTWCSKFETVTIDDSKTLLSNDDVDAVSLQKCKSGVNVNKKSNSAKTKSDFLEVNDSTYDIFNVKVSEGSFPTNSSEILVAKGFIDDNKLSWKVGQTIKLNETILDKNGKETEVTNSYKLVGITDSRCNFVENHSICTALDSNYKGSDLDAYVRNTKINNSIFDTIKSDAKSISRANSNEYHNELFMYAGVIQDNEMLVAIGGFAAIILIIILVASVFMIYNSFAVSFQQRSRYLGMLASIGATRHQKRSSIYFEGLVLGAIGIPLGIIAGIGGIAVTFKCIGGVLSETLSVPMTEPLTVKFSWIIVIGSVIISAFTIFISAFIPAHKASKTTAIEAIRQTNTVKVKSRKLKSSKLVGKLFGFEGQVAMKNYKRNGKRSRTITSALAISIILFLTVTSFTASFTQLFESNYGGAMCDVYVQTAYKNSKAIEKQLDSMKKVDSYYRSSITSTKTNDVNKYLSDDGKKYEKDAKPSEILIYSVSEQQFNDYCKKIGVDSKSFYDKNAPTGILVNRNMMAHVGGKSQLTINAYTDEIENQKLDYKYVVDDKAENVKYEKAKVPVTISKVTFEDITQDSRYFTSSYIVMPIDTFLSSMPKINSQVTYSIKATEHKDVYNAIDEFMSKKNIENMSYDATEQMAAMRNILTIVNVFTYGFITLITLISVMNIINTISTSMDERRREFAMIKSVGLTPKGFKKMIYLESIYYGIKSILWGIPISLGLNYLMYFFLSKSYDFGFKIQWIYYLIAVVAVFAVIGIALLYSTTKIKKDNIIETLKGDDV